VKELILSIVQNTPTSTRAIGALLRRRRVDVAEHCRDLAAEGLLHYDPAHRVWRIPEPAAVAPEPQPVEPPAAKPTAAAAFTPVEVLRDDEVGVLVIETAPGAFSIKCPSSLRADIAESIADLTNERIDDEQAAAPPLTRAERRRLRNMIIRRVWMGSAL
jgi:hypothetical protein